MERLLPISYYRLASIEEGGKTICENLHVSEVNSVLE
nr:MAG TPA: hypothetical protein [Caudoviricetes sp.]